ncbi:MAG: choice-of-anchor B family protein [candidate division Zixibacteria bacterium]
MKTIIKRHLVLDILTLSALFCLAASVLQAQDTSLYSLCLEEQLTLDASEGSDCWGWRHPSGTEYAIMGVGNGIAFVNTDNMLTEGFAEGPTGGVCGGAFWRDMMTWGNYCYAVSECLGTNDGIIVIDMSFLPDSVHIVGTFAVNSGSSRSSHNLCVDSLKGYLYVEGSSSANNTVYIHDLSNPASPSYVTSFGISGGIHDIYAMNDTVYVAEGWNGSFSIWDLTNKSAPAMLVRISIPNSGYVHNCWPTDNREYIFTTEETTGKTVKCWDIKDFSNVTLAAEYLGPNGMAHNAQVKGDRLYLSHYESGVAVLDISDPTNLLEIGLFDSYPEGEGPPAFNGTWGCYPFASNGLIYGSNIDGRLWILSEESVSLADTIYPGPPTYFGSGYAKIDIYAVNTQPLKKLVFPFSYAGDAPMTFVACSTNGTRTSDFSLSRAVDVDIDNSRVVWEIAGTELSPGSGKVLTAWFRINFGHYPGTLDHLVFIDNWDSHEPTFYSDCFQYRPFDLAYVDYCCEGLRGNINNDPEGINANIIDLVYLVDYVFRGGPAPLCPAEANIDGIGGSGDVIDLTYLVDYIFRGGPGPVSCD